MSKAQGGMSSPGIIVTPAAIDEYSRLWGDFHKNMFAKCPADRPGRADEIANARQLIRKAGAFITGSTIPADGSVSGFCGCLL